ncbi:MAG: biotin--[acetyl-CoA-carboxylase] ligase [bacterium]|nr:biotin--[acetyl-CoA-carboxylase] ligase [bacterium]
METHSLPLPQGYQYFWFDEIDSTNQEALRQCAKGQKPNSWFCADRQSNGRGTKGSQWISQTGNLYASLLIRSNCSPEHLAQISIIAALASITAIEQMASDQFHVGDLCVKWPNDILLKERKVCGILIESKRSRQSGLFDIVIGTGLNLASNPQIKGLVAAGNLLDNGWSCSRDELFVALAQSMRDWLSIWQDGEGFETLRLAWLERSCHIGQTMTIMVGDVCQEGRMTTISRSGALVLEDCSGEEKTISSGTIIKIEGSGS